MALLVVVVLGVPNVARAGQPSVQAPTGSQSGGVFNGPFTFVTYIYCSGGFNFSSSYTSSLDGTHTFSFWGSADGSLLVGIDGGGLQLITSCGDPLTGPNVNVASYTVSKNTAPPPTPTPTPPPPTPTPTPTPTPASTPTPSGGGGTTGGTTGHTGGGGSAPAASSSGQGQADTQAPSVDGAPIASVAPQPGAAAPITKSGGLPVSRTTPKPSAGSSTTVTANSHILVFSAIGFGGLLLLGLILVIVRSRRARDFIETIWRRIYIRLEPFIIRLKRAIRDIKFDMAAYEPKRRGLSHHHHTGKLIAHHHTSYPALAFLIALSAILAAGVSVSTLADSQLSLTVLGPPPTVAATIDQPVDGDHFAVSSQTVRGTCPVGLMIEIYRNNIFAGSTLCDSGGLYNLVITLTSGQNDLVARDLDGLNQYGPDSAMVTVFYDAPIPTPTPTPSPTPTPTPATTSSSTPTPRPTLKATPRPKPTSKPTPVPVVPPFYLDTASHFFQGADPSVPVSWQIQIHGGSNPYLITWEWGDRQQDTSTSQTAGPISNSHTYQQSGIYHITIRARDNQGREATISVLAIVNGFPAGSFTRPIERPGNLVYIWPLLVMSSFMVLSFWLGERHKLNTTARLA